ncbi:hypothetical protein SAMD00019534_048980 [Acytostelium subglobosum LB1]|uniref:hypothetical protein n=1 Tax=Acytostelium subglobosum LB1 TaxID=1410327 RepID=UPI000645197C|nr:hypothetical protein SAMD00019534_048980 [Acytostelium subglobosum LB1]GAM21723.1 hypothetical protein SAMD00019534_048980 [Acytostelium subglobosum LB1]|eukprot:XP_012754823.1 hypothetical protein SAMD00019534_048980 [Acytostelium subglobosum LB1]
MSSFINDNDYHIGDLPSELEDIDDPLKKMAETVKIFSALKMKCNDRINDLSKCHSYLSEAVKSTRLFKEFTKDKMNVKLVMAGPTHSGKSTLINTLLSIFNLMPSGAGHTSGRICVLAHSKTINIKFFKVIQSEDHMPNTLQCLENETIKIGSNTFNLETRKILHTHLVRPVGIDNDSDAFEEWASKIVRVEFPSPLLETGMEIIDVPGFSKSDQSSLFSIRRQFFNVYSPTGILFCYPNTFSDAEVLAVKDLNESLPANWSETNEYFFFANTKTSKSEVATNNNIDKGEDVPLELIDSHSDNCFSKIKASRFGNLLQECQKLVDTFSNTLCRELDQIIDTIPSVVKSALANKSNQVIIQRAHDAITNVAESKEMKYIIEDIIKEAFNPIDELITNKIQSLTETLLHEREDLAHDLLKNASRDVSIMMSGTWHHLLCKSIKWVISPYEDIMRHFRKPKLEWGDLNNLIRKYPGTIDITSMKFDVLVEVLRNKSSFNRRLKGQHESLGLIVNAGTMNFNIDMTLQSYVRLFNDVWALHSQLVFPFDTVTVDRTKAVAWGDIGPVYNGSFRNTPYLIQEVPSTDVAFELPLRLTIQAMFGHNVAKSKPMLPLRFFFKSDVTGGGWLLLYQKHSPLMPYLEENISTMSVTQSLAMIKQLIKALEYVPYVEIFNISKIYSTENIKSMAIIVQAARSLYNGYQGNTNHDGFPHEKVRLEYMYMDVNTKDIYLASFGHSSTSDFHGLSNLSWYSTEKVLASLAVVIAELLPKPILQRYTDNDFRYLHDPINQWKPKGVDNKHHGLFVDLIRVCLGKTTIKEVQSKLEDISKRVK